MPDTESRQVKPHCPSSPTGGDASVGEPLQVVLGRRLRRLRLERGFDREGVAARLGVPVDHVAAHERGIRRFKAQELLAYGRLLEVRISSFFVPR